MENSPHHPMQDEPRITVKVVPGAKNTKIMERRDDGSWRIHVSGVAEKGKANTELLRFLRELTGVEWEIVSGHTSAHKRLKQQQK